MQQQFVVVHLPRIVPYSLKRRVSTEVPCGGDRAAVSSSLAFIVQKKKKPCGSGSPSFFFVICSGGHISSFPVPNATDMSHIFGTADSSTVTSSTGLQHQPSSPSVARDIFSRGETGTVGYGINNVSGGGGYDNSKPAISQQQLDFYNHSLAVAFGGGSFSTAPMVAPTHQSSPARPNAALVHSTMPTGASKSVNGGGGELASAVSSTLASGEINPTSAIASVSPAILSCETTPAVTISPSTTWSGTSSGAAVPHAIPGNYFTPASSGGGIEFCQVSFDPNLK